MSLNSKRIKMKSTESLLKEGADLKEVELMLTIQELQTYAAYCLENDIKFNDWIRQLAEDVLKDKQK